MLFFKMNNVEYLFIANLAAIRKNFFPVLFFTILARQQDYVEA